MHKLLLIIVMMTVWLAAHALQTDEELAIKTLFDGKHAVNRAVHAAAQQLDEEGLSEGRLTIDEEAAASAAYRYLQSNLKIDGAGNPLPESSLKEHVDVVVFEVINSNHSFPYTYNNDTYHYSVQLSKPGIVMIIRLSYPRIFRVLDPITWSITGTAELTGY